MQFFLIGLVTLIAALMAAHWIANVNTVRAAQIIRVGAGWGLLAAAVYAASRTAIMIAALLAAAGLWILNGGSLQRFGRTWTGAPMRDGVTSRIVTEHLDLELEHETGAIRGHVIKGFFAGKDIERLRPVELAHLWSDCQFADPASAQVLEAYLDRIHPTWREDMARTGGPSSEPAAEGQMSRAEALDILGLKDPASEDQIRRAHRDLIMKLHPDRGGSHTLAAKVNEAKQVLLGDKS